jgi:hypothetical protein
LWFYLNLFALLTLWGGNLPLRVILMDYSTKVTKKSKQISKAELVLFTVRAPANARIGNLPGCGVKPVA